MVALRNPSLESPAEAGRFALKFYLCVLFSGLLCFNARGDWKPNAAGREMSLNPGPPAKAGFKLLSSGETGLAFTNLLASSRSITNQMYLNGSGVAAGDVDGDGLTDVIFGGIDNGCAMFRNLGGWRFTNITAEAGLKSLPSDVTGLALADLDGDGHLDLVVNTLGRGTHLMFNDGLGHFAARAGCGPFNGKFGGMSAALADMDGDGDLDLYVANYRTVTLRDEPGTRFNFKTVNGSPEVAGVNGRPITDPDLADRFNFTITLADGKAKFGNQEQGEPDLLLRNDGNGKFSPVSWTDGSFLDEEGKPLAKPPFDWGLSVLFRDLNGDGFPDLYVCNDFKSPDRIWLNDGHGRFRAAPKLSIRHTSLSSMGVDAADLNHDGFDDLFVADMLSPSHFRRMTQFSDLRPEPVLPGQIDNRPQYPRNTLLLNRGDGTYAEIAQLAGLEATDWTWTVLFLDVDLDGNEDLLVVNGFDRDNMNIDVMTEMETAKKARQMSPAEQLQMRAKFPRLAVPNMAFRNQGGLRFESAGAAWGFDQVSVSNGMCLADLDNDGDMDVLVNNLNEGCFVLRNETAAPRVAVRLRGLAPNTRGIGARIQLTGGPFPLSQEMIAGGRYLSSDDPMRTFAALAKDLRLEVRWRSGRRSVLTGVQPNQLYELDEAKAAPAGPQPVQSALAALFEDRSSRLNHAHADEPFDDTARQPLMLNKLSQAGPGVAWFDFDGDGLDDLIVGAGKGGVPGVWRNDGKGGLTPVPAGPGLAAVVTRDMLGLAAFHGGGVATLLAASANYEDGLAFMSSVRRLPFGGAADDSIAATSSSPGPLALADIDGDGDLDLFVGGRVVPGKYPQPADSYIYLNNQGKFTLDAARSKAFAKLGMVSAACFSDLNGDGKPDLALALEWGPPRVFLNEGGTLIDRTRELGLAGFTGWWNSVAAGDFDGDGRMDLALGNLGWNSKYEAHWKAGLRVYHGDFDGDGTTDLIESHFEEELKKWVPSRGLEALGKAMPMLRERFPTHAAFARAGMEEVLGDQKGAPFLEVHYLESMVFLNRGEKFEGKALPLEAQFAPVFGLAVGDLDGDGQEDLFAAQNLFATAPEVGRYDAGQGLVLRGDGRGGFKALGSAESGIRIDGEQRGAALADYDGDGRLDLVVAQNAGPTRLFHNLQAAPGLRVRLKGSPQNPDAIGTQLRLCGPEGCGPTHEIHAGSGYLSQDSSVAALGWIKGAKVLKVRWPDGRQAEFPVEPGAVELTVSY